MNKKSLIILILCLSIGVINNPLKVSPLTVSAQESVQVTAEVLYNNLNVRTEPMGMIVGQLQMGAIVIVDAREVSYWGLWVSIVDIETQLTGWVDSRYVVFSILDWTNYVPLVEKDELSTLYPQSPAPYQATVVVSMLNVHSEPSYYSRVIGQLAKGSNVIIYGTALINDSNSGLYSIRNYNTGYVYIAEIGGDLEGWVEAGYLVPYLQFENGERIRSSDLPVLLSYPLPLSEPIRVQGQIIAYVNISGGLRLRSEANTNAEIRANMSNRTLLAIHGRTNNQDDAWVYVTVLETGQNGWVYDPATAYPQYIHYPEGFSRSELPILPSVIDPEVPPSVAPIDSLVATTNGRTILWAVPFVRFNQLHEFGAGIVVTVVGRNINSRFFKVIIAEWEGWMQGSELVIEGDYNRLPIMSLNDGTRTNTNYD